ncbi:MAG: TIM barrel protein [Mycobacterium sp.]
MADGNTYVANCSLLYADTPPLRRAAAAVADGYRELEFWWPFDSSVPGEAESARFVDSVHESGAQVIAMNFTLGDPECGGRGILSHPDRRNEFAEHLEVLAGLVARLGIRWCHAPYGLALAVSTPQQQRDTAVANLMLAADRLRPLGAAPMVEPTSGVIDYPVVTAADAVALITDVEAAAGRPGAVGLLADLYHLAANGEDIAGVLRAHWGRIVHVQVADFPGRHEPGTGELDIDGYLRMLHELGYRGRVALEYIPSL